MMRWKKLQRLIQEEKLDAVLVEEPIDLFYLTGFNLSAGKLIVHSHGAHLIVDGRYFEQCKRVSVMPVVLASENALKVILKEISPHVKTLAFCRDTTSYERYVDLKQLAETLSEGGIPLAVVPIENPVKKLRSIKDESEIVALREAARLDRQGLEHVSSLLQEGISETELATELEIFWKRHGGEKVAFDPIVAFGSNTSMPHYRAGSAKLQKGQHVLFDIGVTLKHYQSDMTRVLFFGTPDPEMSKLYTIIQEAQQAALALCKPGTPIGALDAAAREWISSKGYGEFFTHSLGHGVGLEVHEMPAVRNAAPFKDVLLSPGMVITIEPGIYLPGKGGVRYEDTILITPDGYENLTK